MSNDGEEIILTDIVVTIHIVDSKGSLFDSDHVVQKIHLLGSDATVDDCLVKLLVKGIVVKSGQAPVEESTDLSGVSSVVPFREILLQLRSGQSPVVDLLVGSIFVLSDTADGLEGLLYAGLESGVVSLTHVVLVQVHFEPLDQLYYLVLNILLLDW